MEVTSVKVNPLHSGDGYYKAAATIYLSGGFAVNGIMVAERNGEVKIRFPFVAQKGNEAGQRTFAFAPLSARARKKIESAIREAYYRQVAPKEE